MLGLLLILCLSPGVLNLRSKNSTSLSLFCCTFLSLRKWKQVGQLPADGRVGVTENVKQNTLLAHVLVILQNNFAKIRSVVWAFSQRRGGPATVIPLKPQPPALGTAWIVLNIRWNGTGKEISKSCSKLEGEIISSFCFHTFYLDPFLECQSYCSDSRIQFQETREGMTLLHSSLSD